MKKTALLIASAFLFSTAAHAHRVWVETAHTHGGEYLEAELGYGEFPELEPIAKDRLHIFSKPMQLVTEKGKENMIQKGTYNYQYRSKLPVKDGSYLVTAEYQPTFWSKNSAGWKQASIKEMPDASYCEQTRMFGKTSSMSATKAQIPPSSPNKSANIWKSYLWTTLPTSTSANASKSASSSMASRCLTPPLPPHLTASTPATAAKPIKPKPKPSPIPPMTKAKSASFHCAKVSGKPA